MCEVNVYRSCACVCVYRVAWLAGLCPSRRPVDMRVCGAAATRSGSAQASKQANKNARSLAASAAAAAKPNERTHSGMRERRAHISGCVRACAHILCTEDAHRRRHRRRRRRHLGRRQPQPQQRQHQRGSSILCVCARALTILALCSLIVCAHARTHAHTDTRTFDLSVCVGFVHNAHWVSARARARLCRAHICERACTPAAARELRWRPSSQSASGDVDGGYGRRVCTRRADCSLARSLALHSLLANPLSAASQPGGRARARALAVKRQARTHTRSQAARSRVVQQRRRPQQQQQATQLCKREHERARMHAHTHRAMVMRKGDLCVCDRHRCLLAAAAAAAC